MVGLYTHYENPSDVLIKSVTPIEQFCRMRDVINGSNPVLFVSQKVKDILQMRSFGVLFFWFFKSSATRIIWPDSSDIWRYELFQWFVFGWLVHFLFITRPYV